MKRRDVTNGMNKCRSGFALKLYAATLKAESLKGALLKAVMLKTTAPNAAMLNAATLKATAPNAETLKVAMLKALTIILIFAAAVMAGAGFEPSRAYAAEGRPGIAVSQKFISTSASANSTFTYRLAPLAPGNPMPEGNTADGYTFTLAGDGETEIEAPRFERQGIYKYTLYQIINEETSGYTYDRQAYLIEAYVGVSLNAKFIVTNADGAKTEQIIFENAYRLQPSDSGLMWDPPIVNTVYGNPGQDSVFTFRLAAQYASQPMPQGSLDGVKTVAIVGSGANAFGVWSYDIPGIYYYTAYEVDAGISGYTYDTTVYTITDTVTEVGGRLVVERVVTNESNRQVRSLTFINTYNQGGGSGGGNTGGGNNPNTPPGPPPAPKPSPTATPVAKQETTTTPKPAKTPPPYAANPSDTDELPYTRGDNDGRMPLKPSKPENELITHEDGFIEIDENGVPRGRWEWDDGEGVWKFYENPPPRGDVIYKPGNSPKTGDESNAVFHIILLIVSIITAAGSIVYLIAGVRQKGAFGSN